MFKQTIEKVRSWWRGEGQEEIETPPDVEAAFTLEYRDLTVGSLRVHGGRWEFRYSSEFQRQSEVHPLIDFPDPKRTYQSEELWPFFMARIPSVAQPQVQAIIEQEQLDGHSSVDLLRRFGRRTIANPFVLEAV